MHQIQYIIHICTGCVFWHGLLELLEKKSPGSITQASCLVLLLHGSQSWFYTVSTGVCLLMHSVEKAVVLIIVHFILDIFLMDSLAG